MILLLPVLLGLLVARDVVNHTTITQKKRTKKTWIFFKKHTHTQSHHHTIKDIYIHMKENYITTNTEIYHYLCGVWFVSFACFDVSPRESFTKEKEDIKGSLCLLEFLSVHFHSPFFGMHIYLICFCKLHPKTE